MTTQSVTNNSIIPDEYLDLLVKKKAFAHLATKCEDGSIQSTPVWVDFDGDNVLVNTARGRLKDKNLHERSQTAVSIHDPEDPYRYLEVRGEVVEETEDGAGDHIDKMAKKYLGEDEYPFAEPGEVRVMYKIKPEHYTVHEN